jgi:predicted  nucleic acid-binding Zn-ribbon protein
MKYCSKCGAEIMEEAVICPKCGCPQEGYKPQNQKTELSASEKARQARIAKQGQKKPIFKRWWFWVLIVVFVIIIIPKGGSNTEVTNNGSAKTEVTNSGSVKTEVTNSGSVKTEVTNSGSKKTETRQNITYTQYKAKDLFDELDNNAMKAEKTHQDEYVEIEGYLSVIDSDGKYIAIGANPDAIQYMLDSIHCTFTDNSQKDIVMEMNKGDKLKVKGKITNIGEILGYTLDIHSIEKAS